MVTSTARSYPRRQGAASFTAGSKLRSPIAGNRAFPEGKGQASPSPEEPQAAAQLPWDAAVTFLVPLLHGSQSVLAWARNCRKLLSAQLPHYNQGLIPRKRGCDCSRYLLWRPFSRCVQFLRLSKCQRVFSMLTPHRLNTLAGHIHKVPTTIIQAKVNF